MTKQKLSIFFALFLGINIFLVVLSFIFAKTGFSNYLTHTTKYWHNDRYLADTFKNKQNTMLASNNGKVQANIFEDAGNAWQNVREVSAYISEVNNRGFAVVTMESIADGVIGQTVIGCPITDLNNGIAAVDSPQNFQDTEVCTASSGLINKIDDNLAYNRSKGGGLISVANKATQELLIFMDTSTSTTLYANSMIEQIPFVGSKVVKAGVISDTQNALTGQFESTALNRIFFDIWEASRNLTYYLIIIPTIAFGFAIMFRMQINPQTQITLMRAIPRLLIAILLITFSYPIIALMIQFIKPIINVGVALVWSYEAAVPDYSYVASSISTAFSLLSQTVDGVAWIILGAIWLVVALISLVRFVFALFISAVKLGLLIAFGPLILLVGAFPGREGLIKNYFLHAGSVILGFAVIIITFNLSAAFIGIAGSASLATGTFIVRLVFLAISIAVMWKAPSVTTYVQQALGVQPLFGGGDQKGKR